MTARLRKRVIDSQRKLTWGQACEIAERVSRGESQRSVAAAYEVSQSLVSQIVRGVIWLDEQTPHHSRPGGRRDRGG